MDASLQLATLLWLLATYLTSLCDQALADVPPRFTREPTSKIQRPLDRVKLRCSAEPEEAEIWWTLNGVNVENFPNIDVNRDSLVIRNFESDEGSFSHVGEYQCIAKTSVGSIASRIARVDVAYINKFRMRDSSDSEVLAWVGRVAVIPCTPPESLPPARMEYSFKNRWITESTDHYRIMPSGNLHILNVSSSDAGIYGCMAVNEITNKRHSARNGTLLVVRQGEPEDIEEPPRIAHHAGAQVARGESTVLECVVEGGRPTLNRVRWEKMTGDLSPGSSLQPGSLAINSASVEDDGRYVCILEYRGEEVDRQYVTLKVTKAPSIRANAGPQEALASFGTSVEFSCSVSRVMPDDIRWLHDAKKIDTDTGNKYSSSGSTLTVRNVQQTDLGMYQCLVNSEQGSVQAAARLSVAAGFPRVNTPPINTTAIEDETVSFECVVTGTPRPLITWQDPQNRPIRNTAKTTIVEDTDGLTVYDVDLSDVGWYTCTASNKHGYIKSSAYLSVIEKISSTPTTPTQGVPRDPGISTIVDSTMQPGNKPPPEPPSKPQVIKISDTSVEVQWAYTIAENTSPVTGFTVQYLDVRSSIGWRTASNSVGPNQRSYHVTSLVPTDIYRFRVMAHNRFGNSPYSEMSNRYLLEIDTAVEPPKRPPSMAPWNLKCEGKSSSSVLIQWEYTAPRQVTSPVEGFYVFIRHIDSDDERDYIRYPVSGAEVRSHRIDKLETEETYNIKVKSFNSEGESTRSKVISCTTLTPQTEPPSIIIYPSQPVRTHNNDGGIPDIPDDPTPPSAHAPSGQNEDILYITLGVVLGAMLLVLIMFAVMCVWRAKQVNRDPNHWTSQPYYDGNFRYVDSGKYSYINGNKLNSNHSGPNGVVGNITHNPFNETNGSIEARPLYALPQDALGTTYIPCGTTALHHDSAPESSIPHEDVQLHHTSSANHLYNSLSNGSLRNHDVNNVPPPPLAPRPVCQIMVNPRYQREGGGCGGNGSQSLSVHDRPHRTDGLQGCDRGSLTVSLPSMPPDLGISTSPPTSPSAPPLSPIPPPLSPISMVHCCAAHSPSRSRSESSQSEASSQNGSSQSESPSHGSSSHSSRYSSSSKITDV